MGTMKWKGCSTTHVVLLFSSFQYGNTNYNGRLRYVADKTLSAEVSVRTRLDLEKLERSFWESVREGKAAKEATKKQQGDKKMMKAVPTAHLETAGRPPHHHNDRMLRALASTAPAPTERSPTLEGQLQLFQAPNQVLAVTNFEQAFCGNQARPLREVVPRTQSEQANHTTMHQNNQMAVVTVRTSPTATIRNPTLGSQPQRFQPTKQELASTNLGQASCPKTAAPFAGTDEIVSLLAVRQKRAHQGVCSCFRGETLALASIPTRALGNRQLHAVSIWPHQASQSPNAMASNMEQLLFLRQLEQEKQLQAS